ncbi:LamG-like jellyroll fold domain-containing protein [Mariniradius sediminis]|uniref:T9SS type A sorting domain-containing protein n=1 Tax=Mariniradius sediminis TaxID=2909237 RepID=A0ABS9BR35_9BACT|nr:T9SS type A sorting domain-containing protein [Mariniradius sediminis]
MSETRTGVITFRGSRTGEPGLIDSQKDVGGWPTLKSLPAPLDSDQDGMPDVWETANNLNPNRSNDREYNLSPYYTDIEVYINSLVDNLIKGQYPSTPLGVNPILPTANATNISPVDISFAWSMVANADSYQIQISKSSSFSTGNITLSNQKNLSLVYPQLDANSTYYWRVRAVRNGVSGPYSSARIFQTNSLAVVPGRTQLLFPYNNLENVSLEPVFSWAKVPNTESYQIQISTLSDFSTLLVNQSGLTENSFQSPRLAENQTYYWRVRGRNITGTGSFSNVGVFKTISQSTVPDIVVAIRPSNGVVINPVNIRLDWQAVAGADSYTVQVSTSSSFSNLLVNQSGITELYFDIANLNSNTLYYWRVRGVNRSGNGSFSKGDLSFRTGPFTEAPAQITLVNPAHDSNLFSTSISFSWTKDPIAKGYTFQLSTREDFSSFVTNVSNLTSTSRTVSGLQANTQYFWRVWASNEAGNSPMSEVRKVRSATYSGRPAATTLLSPSNNAVVGSVDIAFTWNNQPNSNAYRLEVSEFSNFSSIAYSKSSIPGTTWIVPSLTQNKTYFWRVRTSNPAGTGSYSEIWKFSTSGSTVTLNQPTLASPSNAALHQATTVNFTWNAVTNATGYDLQISESNTFSNIAFSLSNVNTNSGSISNLAESKTYFWRVRAKAGTANSAWSSVWNFSTKGQSEGTTLDAGLVGYWTMEEGSGSRLLDQSPNSNHLNLQNLSGTSWEAGVNGSAVGLNGNSNSFATISHNSSLSIPNAITISAWVKPNLLHRGTILYKSAGNGFEFWLDSDGQLEFRLNRSTNGSTYRLRSNFNYGSSLRKWIHVAATFDGSTCKIYINGVEDKSVTYNPFTIGTTSGNLILGALGTIQRWQGAMDEVRLYNRALSLQEINMAMQNSGPLETNSSQMAGHWKMDEGSGNLFRDDSGNANNGTILNTSGITWSTAQVGLGVDLNGFSDRFARVPHHPSLELPNALSIASWVKPNALNRGTIVSKSAGNGFELWLDIDGFIEFRLNRTNNGSTYRLRSNYNYSGDLGKWIHIAATFDGRTSKIYVNGIENVSKTYAAPFGIGTSSGDLFIGAMGTVQRMNGSLDDLRIYGKAISDGEIRALVDQGIAVMRLSATGLKKSLGNNQTPEKNQTENSVTKLTQEQSLKPNLYPNPVEEKINLKSLWLYEGPVKIKIYDTNGKMLFDQGANIKNASLEIEISDLSLNTGIYILVIHDALHSEFFKFIKR